MQWESKWEKSFRWHRWFAWYPVTINKMCYWLEYVERRRSLGGDHIGWERKELE